MTRTSKAELLDLCQAVFCAMDMDPKDALTASEVLIAADLRGIDSHGISRLSGYVALWEAGRINCRPDIRIVRSKHSVLTVDGDAGLGLLVAEHAMKLAIERCKAHGSGWVAIRNSNHFGIAGHYAMMASSEDLIGHAMTNATPFIPPTGSKEARLGTNPLAYAFPSNHPFDVVIDLATSAVARGKIEIARREGKTIPKGWVTDKEGLASTDINILKKGGMLSPLGSLEELSSHKGFALGSLVDIMSAVLSGANYGKYVPPFVPYLQLLPNRPGLGLGHFVGAMDIDGFRPIEEFKQALSDWIDHMKSAEPLQTDREVRVPGEPEYLQQQDRLLHGIPLNDKVEQDLEALRKKFDLKV